MQFRWAVGITLWTMIVGPAIGPPASAPRKPSVASASRPAATPQETNPKR